ncbi:MULTISPECIES: hypothetical protein [unclassified Streptomyces]|uniref:hypothetical protein n=1 Tax=unclassified Streptomyces TaxID=2593676 RepID=UPI00380577DE
MLLPRARAERIDDRELAALLADEALLEIRSLARRAKTAPQSVPATEAIDRIRVLADFCHDMRGVAGGPAKRTFSRGRPPSRREQAIRKRPMSYRWNVASEERRAWILRYIDQTGYKWTPPRPLPTPRKGASEPSVRQRLGALAGWPVKTPVGRRPLPRPARVLKALDRDGLFALYQEAERLRLGLGKSSPWFYAHLDADSACYIFPDPAPYYWPDADAGRHWWQCRVLVRMTDGEQVTSSLAVLPETFTTLPSTVPRRRQRRLALTSRLTERDVYLWGRDHDTVCNPDYCGYTSPGGHSDA